VTTGTISIVTGRSEFEFMTSVVPVLETTPRGIVALGTAFFVSERGVLVTARHVVDGRLDDDVAAGDHLGQSDHGLFILVPSDVTSEGQRHRASLVVTQVALEPQLSDVAILVVDMDQFPVATRQHLKPWTLAHFRPIPGESSWAAGYAGMVVGETVASGPSAGDIEWHQALHCEEGPIEEVLPGGRDPVMAPHPCFSVSTNTAPGMSGGPVFTSRGIGGVVSLGMSQSEELPPYSVAALISSGYHLGVDLVLDGGRRTYLITDLIRMGEIGAVGPATAMVVNDGRLEVVWF